MSELINGAINLQISILASSTQSAAIFVTVLDCLAVYAFTLPLRKRVGQTEFSVLLFAIVIITMVVLELIQGGA